MTRLAAPFVGRRGLIALGGASALAGVASGAMAAYPDRPVRLIVGYPAGGGTDYVARMVAARLTQALGQQVVVINQPGASGAIALERVAHAPPDGHSLIVISAADTLLPALRPRLPFDLGRDFVAVAPAVTGSLSLVVNPSLPARTVTELIALAHARPGELNYGSPGVGNSQHLAGEVFNRLAGIRIVHIPFKGGAEAIAATVSGDTQVTFASIAPALPLVAEGRLRLLAVTSATRSAAIPDTPTIAEAGVPGYDRSTWFGLAAPAGTPQPIVLQLNVALTAAMRDEDTRRALLAQGLEPLAGSEEQFAAFLRSELAGNAVLVRDIGIPAE